MTDPLARSLWQGDLADRTAPGRDLARAIADGLAYPLALAGLRTLARHGLPDAGALAQARRRWPQSIDRARIALDLDGDTDTALDDLARIVRAQNRRLSVLARALWARGRSEAALAVFDTLDPASDTAEDDRATQGELAILADAPGPPVPGPRGIRLSFLADWRRQGGAVLARRYDLERAGLPAHPALWSWLVETFAVEGDHARARHALGEFAARCPGAADLDPLRIRLALDGEMPMRARRILDAMPDRDAPWRWGARRHAQHLRCLANEIAANDHPDHAPLRRETEAALRLFPGHGGLQALHMLARELTEPRAALARALTSGEQDARARAGTLIRLGRHDLALEVLDRAPPGPPDESLRRRIRRAEALFGLGDLGAARDALGPVPEAAAPAADHAYWAAEIALARRDLIAAETALGPALTACPSRVGLILTAARARFMAGDAPGAQALLARFRALKTEQIGHAPPDDLRDRIVRDALSDTTDPATGPSTGPSVAGAARALALTPPSFVPVPGARIPRRIAHYWEGPRSPAIEDGLDAWAEFPQTLFDAPAARLWLAAHAPDLGGAFDRLAQPAARADLFRVAWIAHEGGLFADLDERPRASVASWLDGARAVLVIEQGHGTIANNFLAAEPGLALFTQARERIARRLDQVATPYPWWDCGPAQMTLAVWPHRDTPGLRLLTQQAYDARVATNLPYPHKRGPGHWR